MTDLVASAESCEVRGKGAIIFFFSVAGQRITLSYPEILEL